MIFNISNNFLLVSTGRWFTIIFLCCLALVGCEKGDPTALKEAVNAAELNVTSITVQPVDGTVTTGYEVQFTATGHRPDGSTVDVTNSVTWVSTNTSVVTITSSGLATTAADGSVTISASLVSATGSTSLTASSQPLQSIAILADTATPNNLTVSACRNLQLKAIGTYADGERTVIPITNYVSWSIVAGNGDVNDQGLLKSYSDGIIDVDASLDAVIGTAAVTAANDLTQISVTPAAQNVAINGTLQYSATGTYNNSTTADITDNAAWASSNTAVADFNDPTPGLITALTQGTTNVTASCGATVSSNASLTVSSEVLDYLRLEDANGNNINTYQTQVDAITQLTLRAYYTNGTDSDVTESAQWSIEPSSPTGIVTVSNLSGTKGRVTGVAVGQTNILVTYQQREKVLPVTVVQP